MSCFELKQTAVLFVEIDVNTIMNVNEFLQSPPAQNQSVSAKKRRALYEALSDEYYHLQRPQPVTARGISLPEILQRQDPLRSPAKRSRSLPQSAFYNLGSTPWDAENALDAPAVTPLRLGAHGEYSDDTAAIRFRNNYEPYEFDRYAGNASYADALYNANPAFVTPSRPRQLPGSSNPASAFFGDTASPLFEKEELLQIDPYQISIGEREAYPVMYDNQDQAYHSTAASLMEPYDILKEGKSLPHQNLHVSHGPSNSPVSLCSTVVSGRPNASSSAIPDNSTSISKTPEKSKKKSKIEEKRFRPFHEEKWKVHLQELYDFKKKYGHCLVPHTFLENPNLARWVKRQRRQYKLMKEGDPSSTMTSSRIEKLNKVGFIWDSHEIVWRERYQQLIRYKQEHGHCRVPSYCKKNPQLASWVKCQRRQYKLFWEGKRSSMNTERTSLLEEIGFTWEVRVANQTKKVKKKKEYKKELAEVLKGL